MKKKDVIEALDRTKELINQLPEAALGGVALVALPEGQIVELVVMETNANNDGFLGHLAKKISDLKEDQSKGFMRFPQRNL